MTSARKLNTHISSKLQKIQSTLLFPDSVQRPGTTVNKMKEVSSERRITSLSVVAKPTVSEVFQAVLIRSSPLQAFALIMTLLMTVATAAPLAFMCF